MIHCRAPESKRGGARCGRLNIVCDVATLSGEEVVHTENVMPLRSDVRRGSCAEKACPAGDEDAHRRSNVHLWSPLLLENGFRSAC